MAERDTLSKLLARHRGDDDGTGGEPERLLDDRAMLRIFDASLGVLAAFRTLAEVTEEVVRERRDRIAERASGKPDRAPTRRRNESERIPIED